MKDLNQIETIVDSIIEYLSSSQSLDLLPEIAKKLTEKSWVKIDPNLALISSAVKLSTVQQALVKKTLSQHFHRPIRIKTKLDPAIIAGLKINVAGKIIDATLNHRLESLKDQVIYD